MPETLEQSVRDLTEHVGLLRDDVREEGRLRRRSARWAIVVAVLIVAAFGVGFWYSTYARDQLHRTIDGDCGAFRQSATIPLPASAAPIAHAFVDSFRRAYEGRCVPVGGPLPPAVTLTPTPSPSRSR